MSIGIDSVLIATGTTIRMSALPPRADMCDAAGKNSCDTELPAARVRPVGYLNWFVDRAAVQVSSDRP